VASIYAGTGGYLDRIKAERVQEFLVDHLMPRLHSEKGELTKRITDSGDLSDEDEKELGDAIAEAIDDFGPDFDAEGNPLEEGESDRVKSEDAREEGPRAEGEEGGEGAAAEAETEDEKEEVPA
jgi:F-type H+-transporting ATPase subunit alpha